MNRYIIYLRVSTKKQGKTQYGLEAQRDVCMIYADANGEAIEIFEEVKSGSAPDRISENGIDLPILLSKRPKLMEAIELAKEKEAIILVKELSRLSRHSLLIKFMVDIGIKFICVDNPNESQVMLGIRSEIVEEERRAISRRTKEGLKKARDRGKKLGGYREGSEKNLEKAREVKKIMVENNLYVKQAKGYIILMREKGLSYRDITKKLNKEGFKSPSGRKWGATSVRNVYVKEINSL